MLSNLFIRREAGGTTELRHVGFCYEVDMATCDNSEATNSPVANLEDDFR